jgi:methionyl-tRNA formyltransferase
MRVAFMGTPAYATAILERLLAWSACEVVGVFTQPDKPAGRKHALKPPHVKEFLLNNHPDMALFQPSTLKEAQIQDHIKALAPDFIVVAAYGQLLPRAVLDIAPCVNLHASLLPKFRGASPIQAALIKGEKYTGVTAMLMEEGLDAGPMLGYSYASITSSTTATALFDTLADKAARLTCKVLEHYATLRPLPQMQADASMAVKITKAQGEVDFSTDASVLMRRFNALTPWPGLFLSSGLKLLDVSLASAETENVPQGAILEVGNTGARIACRQGSLWVTQVQAPSKKPLHVKDYLQGKRRGVGDTLL